jgi:hypothetical protein
MTKNRGIISQSRKDLRSHKRVLDFIDKTRAINFGKLHSALCIRRPVACTDWNSVGLTGRRYNLHSFVVVWTQQLIPTGPAHRTTAFASSNQKQIFLF